MTWISDCASSLWHQKTLPEFWAGLAPTSIQTLPQTSADRRDKPRNKTLAGHQAREPGAVRVGALPLCEANNSGREREGRGEPCRPPRDWHAGSRSPRGYPYLVCRSSRLVRIYKVCPLRGTVVDFTLAERARLG